MRLVHADLDQIPVYWPRIEAWVAAALDHGIGYKPEDVLSMCLRGEMQLWIAEDDEDVHACAIGHVVQFPRAKACWILVVGGQAVENWVHLDAGISEWARAQGCAFIEGGGRKGWVRLLRDQGYEDAFSIYRKVLT